MSVIINPNFIESQTENFNMLKQVLLLFPIVNDDIVAQTGYIIPCFQAKKPPNLWWPYITN